MAFRRTIRCANKEKTPEHKPGPELGVLSSEPANDVRNKEKHPPSEDTSCPSIRFYFNKNKICYLLSDPNDLRLALRGSFRSAPRL